MGNKYKGQWHLENKAKVRELFGGKCNLCDKEVGLDKGVAHHTTYKYEGGVYNAGAEELAEAGVVVWVCEKCHTKIHQSEQIDGDTKIIGICVCGKRQGIKLRGELLGLDAFICRICFRKHQKSVIKPKNTGQIGLFDK